MCVCVCVCVGVCVCVCVFNANPLHFMCFGFRAMRIDHLSVVFFRFTRILGRPSYVNDVYLYCVLKVSEVRVTKCNCFVVQMRCTWDDEGKGGQTRCRHVAYP